MVGPLRPGVESPRERLGSEWLLDQVRAGFAVGLVLAHRPETTGAVCLPFALQWRSITMDSEIATYARELTWILEQICVAIRDLTPSELNWRPDTGTANSAYVIASHVVAVTRVYALGFGCGQPVQRDRPAEFEGSGHDAAMVIAHVEALATDIEHALDAKASRDLDRRLRPSRELWGTGEIHEISARDALVESIRHAALHLGELRLTRDLAIQAGAPKDAGRAGAPPSEARLQERT